ncbi:MAG: threonine synthase [Candidatus Bathyarchaeia archaeon]
MEGIKLSHIKALKCRDCGKTYPPTKIFLCENCFGPVDVIYDYEAIDLSKNDLKKREKTLWRYKELLPLINESCIIDLGAGFTPLHKSNRLAKLLKLKELYIKDDSVNPTYSFKDRPSSVAVSKALEFNYKAVGCASTGNLAAATAAHAAKAGLPCYVFIPSNTELNKIIQAASYGANIIAVKGTYDNANIIAFQAADIYDLAIVNVNVRPYYVEGSKTLAFEVCEQLKWETPDHIIVPMASGALLNAICKGFEELQKTGFIEKSKIKVSGAQAEGCAPIVNAFKSKTEDVKPIEKPNTIAKSLAIGDPGDGVYAVKRIKSSGGAAESVSDQEIIEAIKLLAKTEGIFTEPAGAVTIAVLKKLVENNFIDSDEKIVCYVTGNGLKTTEILVNSLKKPIEVEPTIESLENILTEALIWQK